MKRFIFKIVLLGIITLMVFLGLDILFRENHFYEKTINDYRENTDLEIGIFGSSHAYSSYDPRVFESELGVTAFNFGGPAQRLASTEAVAEMVLARSDLKIAVIDIFSMSINEIDNEYSKNLQLKTLDYLPPSLKKLETINSIFDFDQLPYAISPTLRNHLNWHDLNGFDFKRKIFFRKFDDFYKGFMSLNQTSDNAEWKSFLTQYKGKSNASTIEKLNTEEKEKIDRIIEIFQKENVEILFVNAPSYISDYDAQYRAYSKLIRDYIVEKNINFIDFNLLRDSLGLDKVHFRNPNHLNPKGALVVSKYLSDYINKNYEIQKGIKGPGEFLNNRYAHIKDNFKNTFFRKVLQGKDTLYAQGITSVNLFQVNQNRYEVLFEYSSDEIKKIPLKVEYNIQERDLLALPEEDLNVEDNKALTYDVLDEADLIKYMGKNYLVFQFNYPDSKFDDVKLSFGSKRRTKVLVKDKIGINANQ